MNTQEGVPPDSLVARMIGELNANPEARARLLRALLTDDFLLLPAKVDRLMELPTKADSLQEDVAKLMELPAKVDRLQEEVRQITTDLAPIRGSHARDAALRAVRRIARIVNCRLQEQLNDDLHDFTANMERHNLTTRMSLRRYNRKTNAHSKKLEHHYLALSLYFTWYNWIRVHSTIGTTPAVQAGLTSEPYNFEWILDMINALEYLRKHKELVA